MLHRVVAVVIVALTVGCGGATELNGDGSESDGSGGTHAGSGGTGGGTGGGSGGAGTGPTTAGTTPGGGGTGVTASACSGVECTGRTECPDGRTYGRPDGACCAGCIPDEPAPCPEIACPPGNDCPKGYVRGDYVGGCCSECLPDPAYCEFHEECVMANRPRTCCGCAEAISKRALDDNACWTPVTDPRPIPEECYPDVTCDALCECPAPGVAICVDYRCIEVFPL